MSIANLFNRKFYLILGFIFLAELFSLFGYLLSDFNKIGFFIIILLTIIASLIKLEYGLWILFTELFIGSKGYLFFFEQGGIIISIRIALWLVIMSVWFGKVVSERLKKNSQKDAKCPIGHLASNNQRFYFVILFIFIIWGLINGFLNNNEFNNIFFDFNGWLYFALIFPVYSVIKNQQSIHSVLQIFTASIIWLSAKTFFLLFVFSHNMIGMTSELYRWVRVSGVGEITQMQGGFYRIFFQSHIFVLIGFFVFLLLLINTVIASRAVAERSNPETAARFRNNIDGAEATGLLRRLSLSRWGGIVRAPRNDKIILFSVFCFLFSTILISFSRSFWAGLIVGLLFYYFTPHLSSSSVIDKNFFNKKYNNILKKGAGFIILLFYKIGWKKFLINNGVLLICGIVSIGMIIATVKFPYPKPIGGFVTTELLSERAGQITGEAGVSSRWALLPELWQEIKRAPILGQGFGTTVTYQSSDPRVLQSSPTGEYTTYAFEWGWLDIWLKLGFFGMIAYLMLLGKICIIGLRHNTQNKIISGLTLGLVVIAVVSVFSPYMNHPLGIGYLILVSVMILNKSKILNLKPRAF